MPPKSRKYARGIIRPTPYGTWRAEICHAGRRYRQTLPTLERAQAWIDEQSVQFDRTDRPLQPNELYDARHARQLLPQGVSLVQAATHYLQTHNAAIEGHALTTKECIQQFLREKERAGLRPRALQSLRHLTNRLSTDLQDRPLPAITTHDLLAILDTHNLSGASRANHRRAWVNLFNWAARLGYIQNNPAQAITTPKTDPTPPAILDPDQLRDLLQAAQKHHPETLPFWILGAFAGVRRAEILRLTWADIQCPNHIHIPAHAAKLRQQRYIDIEPNAAQWLQLCTPSSPQHTLFPCREDALRHRLEDTRKNAGLLTGWPQNGLRHSYATYHLAHYHDAPRTAHQLGHTSPDTLYRHYRNLATPEQAARYWAIIPPPSQ